MKPHSSLNDFGGADTKPLTLRIKPVSFSGPPQFRRLIGKCFNLTADRSPVSPIEEKKRYLFLAQSNQGQMILEELTQNQKPLTLRIKPVSFSGPPQFRRLIGKCFNLTADSYRYDFCPFHNIAQHEQSLRWSPYSGVLGVWQQWQITNNTFEAMVMEEGDVCGNTSRSSVVFFTCGSKNMLYEVKEPHRCRYVARFQTPLVCHGDAMLVYPQLLPELQKQWDVVETRFMRQELTEQGYTKKLKQLFVAAGLQMSNATRVQLIEAEQKQEHTALFDNLNKCNMEHRKLKLEVTRVSQKLKDNGIDDELKEVRPLAGMGDPDYDDYYQHGFMNDE
ncbi:PREDICTED: N-acetylglucosamine-1-phosphotransferase subunit gamma-like [Priapulus caudatus]|uniref:N-acetylglucosamine-1-phosphotransferase subunit gamma-like n=1 Tax=Priapulus caudatus TaxID=37621 RepID=A0ABM1F4V8_PRICU|nr:PREDICTED: N-acetylglucosamine-1-phosphotransferase subunit gamma-like [Priapulus caudatus]